MLYQKWRSVSWCLHQSCKAKDHGVHPHQARAHWSHNKWLSSLNHGLFTLFPSSRFCPNGFSLVRFLMRKISWFPSLINHQDQAWGGVLKWAEYKKRREEELENMREGSAWVSFGSEDQPGRTRPYMAVQAVQSGRTMVDLNSTKGNLWSPE